MIVIVTEVTVRECAFKEGEVLQGPRAWITANPFAYETAAQLSRAAIPNEANFGFAGVSHTLTHRRWI